MLSGVARALRLSGEERSYLYHLAGETPGPPPGPPRDVRPGVRERLLATSEEFRRLRAS